MTEVEEKQERGDPKLTANKLHSSGQASTSTWVARSRRAYWLNRLRAILATFTVSMLLVITVVYYLALDSWREHLIAMACRYDSMMPLFYPGIFLRFTQTHCLSTVGDTTDFLVIAIGEVSMSMFVAIISLIICTALIIIQPPARQFNAFADRARKRKVFKWQILLIAGVYYGVLPAGAFGMIIFLLYHPYLFEPGLFAEIACSGTGLLLYFIISNALLPIMMAQLVLRGENFLDLPPAR